MHDDSVCCIGTTEKQTFGGAIVFGSSLEEASLKMDAAEKAYQAVSALIRFINDYK